MAWNQGELFQSLQKLNNIKAMDSHGGLIVVMNDYGGLTLSFIFSSQQLVIETVICPVSDVTKRDEFNRLLLRSQKLLPLSSVGLTTINQTEYYIAFGSLSLNSSFDDILLEMTTLAHNALDIAEVVDEFMDNGK